MKNHKRIARPNGYWTKERILKEAKNFYTLKEFSSKFRGAYNIAKRNNFLHECTANLKQIIWTKEKIFKKIKNYSSFGQIFKKNMPLLRAIISLDLLTIIQKKMQYIPNTKYQMTKEQVLKQAKKCSTRTEFNTKCKMAYRNAVLNGWIDECYLHMESTLDIHKRNALRTKKWTKENIFKKINKINSWRELRTEYQGLFEAIVKQNLENEIRSLFKIRTIKYSNEQLRLEALKYTSKQKFRKEKESVLRTIYERGLHHKFLSHMDKTKTSNFLEVERLLLHPKIKKIFKKYNKKFFYEKKYKLNEKKVIPDFIYKMNRTIYIIEAKTSYRKFRKTSIDNQIKDQIKAIKKINPNKKIIHILLSEHGLVNSPYSNFNMSLLEFSFFIKNEKFKKFPLNKKFKNSKELAHQIEQEFRNKIINKRI